MVGQDLMKTQLDSGMLEKPNVTASAQDSGAMSFAICGEEFERENEVKTEFRYREDDVRENNKKYNCWTQTKVAMPPFASIVGSESTKGQQRIHK